MNRQERHAYEQGFTARSLGLPLSVVTDPREREDDTLYVAPAYADHARMGYRDAVCECTHDAGDHRPDHGCTGEATTEGMEGIECPCTSFASAGVAERKRQGQERAEVEAARVRNANGEVQEEEPAYGEEEDDEGDDADDDDEYV